MLNDVAKNAAVKALADQIFFIGIHSLVNPGFDTNVKDGEASGGTPPYERQPIVWEAPADGIVTHSNSLAFDVPPGTYAYYDFFNALEGNDGAYLGCSPLVPLTGDNQFATGVMALDGTITSAAHGLNVGALVRVESEFDEELPDELVSGTLYKVSSAPSADEFQIAGTNEFQTVVLSGTIHEGSRFTLIYDGQTTGDIVYTATADEVQAAMVALSNLAEGGVVVSGGPGPNTPWTFQFTGTLAFSDVVEMTQGPSVLLGPAPPNPQAPELHITTVTEGGEDAAVTLSKSVNVFWAQVTPQTFAAQDHIFVPAGTIVLGASGF